MGPALRKEIYRRSNFRGKSPSLSLAGLNLRCSLVDMSAKQVDIWVRVQATRPAGCAGLGTSTADMWELKSGVRMLSQGGCSPGEVVLDETRRGP